MHRSSRESLRQIPSPKPAPVSSTLPELPTSPTPLPPLLSPKGSSFRSSSITSHQRRKSRMDALACLEGRSRAANRIPRSNLRNNFMSMSDDEEEESKAHSSQTPFIQVEDFGSFADIEDEGDAVVPPPKHFPPKPANFPHSVSVSQPVKRQRKSTVDTWFPLKSFIDLKDDDLSWNWRSFIEIGGIS